MVAWRARPEVVVHWEAQVLVMFVSLRLARRARHLPLTGQGWGEGAQKNTTPVVILPHDFPGPGPSPLTTLPFSIESCNRRVTSRRSHTASAGGHSVPYASCKRASQLQVGRRRDRGSESRCYRGGARAASGCPGQMGRIREAIYTRSKGRVGTSVQTLDELVRTAGCREPQEKRGAREKRWPLTAPHD